MKITGIGIDYSNICKDYNTAYLDRDNLDPATKKCMKQVLTWSNGFLTDLLEHFGYKLHNLSSSTPVKVDDVSSKRFLFYSLEKEITLQSFVAHKEYTYYEGLLAWEEENNGSILIKNDEDGGAIYFFLNEESPAFSWIKEQLKNFTLDEVAFSSVR